MRRECLWRWHGKRFDGHTDILAKGFWDEETKQFGIYKICSPWNLHPEWWDFWCYL